MAGYSVGMLNAALAGAGAYAPWLSLHTADPGATGANEAAGTGYARVQTTWGTPSGASMSGLQVAVTVPAGVTVTYWGCWTLVTAGSWGTGGPLPNSESFTGPGTYLLNAVLTASG